MAQVLIAIAILFTFGLQFYVPMDIIWRRISPSIPKNKHNSSQILLRAGTILIMGGVAAAVPKLEPFIGLVGSVFFSLLGKHFEIKCFFLINQLVDSLCKRFFFFDLGLMVPAVVETVFKYPDFDYGFANWILIKNIILIVFSIFALIIGSVTSIRDIIKIYQ